MSCFKRSMIWCATWFYKLCWIIFDWDLNLWTSLMWFMTFLKCGMKIKCSPRECVVSRPMTKPHQVKLRVGPEWLVIDKNHIVKIAIMCKLNWNPTPSCFKRYISWCTTWYFTLSAMLWKILLLWLHLWTCLIWFMNWCTTCLVMICLKILELDLDLWPFLIWCMTLLKSGKKKKRSPRECAVMYQKEIQKPIKMKSFQLRVSFMAPTTKICTQEGDANTSVISKSIEFQAIYYILMLVLVARISDCRPTERRNDEPYLVLNEVALNFGLNSYVEIYGREMPKETFKDYHFGLIVIQPTGQKKRNRIKALIDLTELRNPPIGKYYLVVGNPSQSYLGDSAGNYFSTNWPMAKPDQVKLFGGPNWLDIEDNDITRIIMTISQTGSIMEKLKWNPTAGSGSSSNYPFLDNEKDLFKYIEDYETDSVIIRGKIGSRTTCKVITDILKPEYLAKGRLKPFLTDPSHHTKSLSKCGNNFLTHYHLSFKAGSLSPGRINDCSAAKFLLKDNLDSVTNLQPESISLDDTCDGPESFDFSKISGDQIDVDKVEQAMVAANSRPDASICPPPDEIHYDMSPNLNELHEHKVKRIKLMKDYTKSEECSPFTEPAVQADPQLVLPFERERHRTLTIDVEYIVKHLPDKFSVLTLSDIPLKYEWFQLVYDHEDSRKTRFNCYYCSRYKDEFKIKTKDNLAKKDGVMFSKERNRDLIRNHDSSSTHMGIKQKFDLKYNKALQDSIYSDIRRNELTGFHVTNNHIRGAA